MMTRLVQAWAQPLRGALCGAGPHCCMQTHCPTLPTSPVLAIDQPLIPGVAT